MCTKTDLVDQRVVTKEEGERFASCLGTGLRYIETSAKTNTGVDEMFETIVHLVKEYADLPTGSNRVRKDIKGRCLVM